MLENANSTQKNPFFLIGLILGLLYPTIFVRVKQAKKDFGR